jgi:hypothetical protein
VIGIPGNADLSDDRVRRSLLRSFGRILGVAKSENADIAASAENGKRRAQNAERFHALSNRAAI